jgi:hypothetical protein
MFAYNRSHHCGTNNSALFPGTPLSIRLGQDALKSALADQSCNDLNVAG